MWLSKRCDHKQNIILKERNIRHKMGIRNLLVEKENPTK